MRKKKKKLYVRENIYKKKEHPTGKRISNKKMFTRKKE